MPVLEPLIEECIRRSIRVETQSGTLKEDLELLLMATTIAAGRGSFIPQIVGLSKCIKNVYFFENGFGLAAPKPRIRITRVTDTDGRYLSGVLSNNWRNTQEQRQLMVSYPAESLRLDG